jgi:hypothetical protein
MCHTLVQDEVISCGILPSFNSVIVSSDNQSVIDVVAISEGTFGHTISLVLSSHISAQVHT